MIMIMMVIYMVGIWQCHIPTPIHYDIFPPGGNMAGGNLLANNHDDDDGDDCAWCWQAANVSLDKAKMPRTTGSLHKDDAEIQNTNMIQKMYWHDKPMQWKTKRYKIQIHTNVIMHCDLWYKNI